MRGRINEQQIVVVARNRKHSRTEANWSLFPVVLSACVPTTDRLTSGANDHQVCACENKQHTNSASNSLAKPEPDAISILLLLCDDHDHDGDGDGDCETCDGNNKKNRFSRERKLQPSSEQIELAVVCFPSSSSSSLLRPQSLQKFSRPSNRRRGRRRSVPSKRRSRLCLVGRAAERTIQLAAAAAAGYVRSREGQVKKKSSLLISCRVPPSAAECRRRRRRVVRSDGRSLSFSMSFINFASSRLWTPSGSRTHAQSR